MWPDGWYPCKTAQRRSSVAFSAFSNPPCSSGVIIRVTAVSAFYETEPVGGPPQGPYLNGAAELVTSLAPRVLLERLLEIEAAAGRRRGAPRNAARPLDLDLLFFGEQKIDEPGLRVPHPRLHERAFVLEPLCEIAARLVHPVFGETIEQLARCVRDPAAVRRRG